MGSILVSRKMCVCVLGLTQGDFSGYCSFSIRCKKELETRKRTSELFAINFLLIFQGFKGLYKGMGTPLMVATPMCAIGFWGYGLGKSLQTTKDTVRLRFVVLSFDLFVIGQIPYVTA